MYTRAVFFYLQCKTVPVSLAFSPDGKLFATMATDRRVRRFSLTPYANVFFLCQFVILMVMFFF